MLKPLRILWNARTGACTFPQPVLCRDGGRTGGTDRQTSATSEPWNLYVLCFKESWGRGRCFCTACVWRALQSQVRCACSVRDADTILSHGNAASDQSEDDSGFGLGLYYKQYMEMEFWLSVGDLVMITLALLLVLLLSLKYKLGSSFSLLCAGIQWEGPFSDTSSSTSRSKLEMCSPQTEEKGKAFRSFRWDWCLQVLSQSANYLGVLISHYCGFFRGLWVVPLFFVSPQMHTYELDVFCPYSQRCSFHRAG